jgi:hypothetical protein
MREAPRTPPDDKDLMNATPARRLHSAAVRCYLSVMKNPAETDVPQWAYVAFAIFLGVGFLAITYFAPMM